jgi:hypothetical protein
MSAGLTLALLAGITFMSHETAAYADGDPIQWKDTVRTAKGVSPATRNNDNVRYGAGCQAASDDGKWCASIVTVNVEIGPGDPKEFYRLKYFQETPENCGKAIRVQSGPAGWFSTIDCRFDPSLRKFAIRVRAWTKPQVFASEITIQERVSGDRK